MKPVKKYKLRSSPGRYLTGRVNGDRQILMGVSCPDYEMHFFDSNGNHLNTETRKLTIPPPSRDGIYVFDSESQSNLASDVNKWCHELEFSDSPIEILRFESNDAYIEDLPSELMELEECPNNFTAEEREELLIWKSDWTESEYFAFWWGDELWIDRDGTVVSS